MPHATQLALGHRHTCALFADGSVRCWGLGTDGRLGTGNTRSLGDDEPLRGLPPVDLGGKAVAITAGGAHTCALLETKQVRCWGWGAKGQLGYGDRESIGDDEAPAATGDVPLDDYATAVSASGDVTCAVIGPAPESVRCWGENTYGQLGYGSFQLGNLGDDESVGTVMPIVFPQAIQQLSYPCALFVDGSVICWNTIPSDHGDSQLKAESRSAQNLGGAVRAMAFNDEDCFVSRDGRARCRDRGLATSNFNGRVVVAATDRTPALVELPFENVTDVGVSSDFGCVLIDRSVRCWGSQRLGLLATPSSDDFIEARHAIAIDVGAPVVYLAVGNVRACAITDSGGVRCWGYAKDGVLGYGTPENVGERRSPRDIGDIPF